jgi:hypothetical protein
MLLLLLLLLNGDGGDGGDVYIELSSDTTYVCTVTNLVLASFDAVHGLQMRFGSLSGVAWFMRDLAYGLRRYPAIG